MVGSDDDSDSDEQARKDQADLAAFRAKEKLRRKSMLDSMLL